MALLDLSHRTIFFTELREIIVWASFKSFPNAMVYHCFRIKNKNITEPIYTSGVSNVKRVYGAKHHAAPMCLVRGVRSDERPPTGKDFFFRYLLISIKRCQYSIHGSFFFKSDKKKNWSKYRIRNKKCVSTSFVLTQRGSTRFGNVFFSLPN